MGENLGNDAGDLGRRARGVIHGSGQLQGQVRAGKVGHLPLARATRTVDRMEIWDAAPILEKRAQTGHPRVFFFFLLPLISSFFREIILSLLNEITWVTNGMCYTGSFESCHSGE